MAFDEGIEPEHGVKGKQRWLLSDEDVADMYTLHDGKNYCGVNQPKKVVSGPTLLMKLMWVVHKSSQGTTSKLIR